jgi:phosphotransferase system  glucose/maltose/N-acetylglucosamine-specific IIC component
MQFLTKDFWDKVLIKLVETFISIKVITIFTVLIVSTWLLILGFLTAAVWGSVNAGVISTVYALREAVKISHINKEREDIYNKEKTKRERIKQHYHKGDM